MSTIPVIFNERKVPHTIVGGTVRKTDEDSSPFSVILLNRGGRYYRSAVFSNLEAAGCSSVISVELSSEPYDIENLSVRFPSVKFLVPLEKVTIGEMINTAMAEVSSPLVLVVWNDVKVTPSSIPARLVARVREEGTLCAAPVLSSERLETLPVQMVPALNRASFQVEPMPCYRDASPTVYPFDFMGIYNREKFIQLGGFDHTIRNPYWQNLDFGFRAHLWGERVILMTSFRLAYESEVPREDVTVDASYMAFFLKNLLAVHRKDEALIPISRFLSYAATSGMNPFDAWSRFSAARKWVRVNRYRFARDAVSLVRDWEPFVQ